MPSPKIKSPLNYNFCLFVCLQRQPGRRNNSRWQERKILKNSPSIPCSQTVRSVTRTSPATGLPPPGSARLCPGVARTTQSAAPRLGARKMLEILKLNRGPARRKLQGELQEIHCRAAEGQNGGGGTSAGRRGEFWFSPSAGRGDALCWRGQSRAGGSPHLTWAEVVTELH